MDDATVGYVGENTGWGRPYDLIDNPDGPYYISDWEPGYPDEVSVELVLAEPVRATSIMVAQNPFRELGGAIQLSGALLDGSPFSAEIALSGSGGWRSHELNPPAVLDRFTVTRADPDANVVELLVCVAP